MIDHGPRSWSSHLSAGAIVALRPREHWKAKRASTGDGKYDAWLKYVGPV